MNYPKQNITDLELPKSELFGIYRGVVEDNDDPLEAGRCKIRIFGIHTENKEPSEDNVEYIETKDLVWAQPAAPIFGGISKVGVYGLPCQGSHVFLFFENGNIMQPRYFASAPGIPTTPPFEELGFSDPDGVYPKEWEYEPDWNKGERKTKYTESFVICDKAGNSIEMDSTEGQERIVIGNTKTKLVFDSKGSLRKESAKGTDETYTGTQKTVVSGDSEKIVSGEETISSASTNISVLGNKKEFIAGASDETVLGIENKVSGGMSWNVQGDSTLMTAGEAGYVADGNVSIKSNTMDVKLEATLQNIKMQALAGAVDVTSMRASTLAMIDASFKGAITTSIGGGVVTNVDGILTTVNGSAITMITGGIIMIG